MNRCKIKRNDFVLEIGSNDGYLGECFLGLGTSYLGIDASPTMVKLANDKGIETWHGLFNTKIAKEVLKTKKRLYIIAAKQCIQSH